MNKYFKKISVCISFLAFFSCNNEVELTKNYQEQAFVYCVINQNDSVHYVRLQRNFQSDMNVEEIANISDSIYFDSAIVEIRRMEGTSVVQTIPFAKDETVGKEDGYFPVEDHFVYSSTAKLFGDAVYELFIYIPAIDKEITATTKLLGNVQLKEEYYSPLFKLNFILSTPQTIGWYTEEAVRAYDFFLRFHYREIRLQDTTVNYFEIPVRSISNNPFLYKGEMQVDIPGNVFYGQVSANLNADPELKRIFDSIDLGFNLYEDAFYSFLEISPNLENAFLNTNFDFDNVINGIGIFSSRKTSLLTGYKLTNRSIDTLSCRTTTKDLNFADHQGFYFCVNH